MADNSPTISTFVVSLDENISPFADFCRHSACDLVESDNPVIMFGLHTIARIRPPGDVNMILGRWPRVFKTLPSLRDNLMDAVTDRLAKGHLVSIILVARSPENINADKVLKPILDDIAQKRRHYSKLWSAGFFTCGPAHGLAAGSALVDGVGAALRNVFFGSDSAQSEGYDLQFRDHANLRFLIDLSRSDGQSKKLFAESTTKTYPKIIWLTDNQAAGEIYPEQLLQKLARFFARIASQGIKAAAIKDDRFAGEIGKFLEFVKPNLEDETPDRLASVVGNISQSIPGSTGFRNSSIKLIEKCNSDIKDIFQDTYQESRQNVEKQLVEADKRITLASRVRAFTLPGGGYSQQDRADIETEKAKLTDKGRSWTSIASEARLMALGQHSDIQNRPDPGRNGSFEFDALDEGVEFNRRIDAALKSSNDLPDNRVIWLFVPLVPLLLILLAIGAHVVSNEFAEFDIPVFLNLLSENIVAVLLIAGTFAIPAIAAVLWRWNFKREAKHKIAKLRNAADNIAKKLLRVAGHTSSYLAHTRSALLAAEGVRRINQRVKEQPFAEMQDQTKGLLPNANVDLAELQEEQVDNKFVERNAPDIWMSDQIKSWRKSIVDDNSKWSMEFIKSMPVTSVKLDSAATPTNMEPIASTYSSGNSHISMAAIPVVKSTKPAVKTKKAAEKT